MATSTLPPFVKKYTKYELTRILGSRALQIASGAPFLVKLSQEDLAKIGYSSLKIAELELEQGVLPITVRRAKPKFEEKIVDK